MRKKVGMFAVILGLVLTTASVAQEMKERVKDQEPGDIIEVASSNDNLSTLVTAVKAAGLVQTLEAKGPYTVFAPTDKAFNALPEGTLEMLLKPENKDLLQSVLTYHVVPGEIMSEEITTNMKAITVEGSKAQVKVTKTGITIDEAKVIKADVDASNGVVHVIDHVILPPEVEKALMDQQGK